MFFLAIPQLALPPLASSMKRLLTLVLVFTSMVTVHADWTTDYKAALVQAKAQNKLVLLDFTGSDWCGYCKLLEKDALSQQAFKDFAEANYVLVRVDFPRQTTLPDDLKQQNDALKSQFHVHIYPTLVVLNGDGVEVGRQEGYYPGTTAESEIARLKKINGK
jgi:protein disulfide-isomerase